MSSPLQRTIILAFFALLALVPAVAPAQTPRQADAIFPLEVVRTLGGGIKYSWNISPGYYLYRDRISARTDDGKPLPVTLPPGEKKEDPNFGATEVYHEKAAASIDGKALPPTGSITVSYQGCAEHGVCYPPVVKKIDLATLAVSNVKRDGASSIAAPVGPSPAAPVQSDTGLAATLSGGLPAMSLSFLGFGLLLALTPCVFPMIPILSGMLARSGERLSARRGLVLSGAYALAMALAYAALGVVAAWSGQNLQVMLQTPLAIGLMSLVFVGLALSMFGLYSLALPAAWTARLSRTTAKADGSIGGAALLGFGSALIVGPCVTPPLAAALLYVAQTGDVARGATALFALGLGMGLPLVLFGTFGGKLLPKSGSWLIKVKQAFGFIFLGLALWILGRMLPNAASRAAWGLLTIATGIWFGTFAVVRHRGQVMRFVGGAVVLYGVFLLANAVGMFSNSCPLVAALDRSAPQLSLASGNGFFRQVTTPAAFDAAMAEARAKGQPILIDFTADWCIVCREIDETVMAKPDIRSRLQNVSIIRADISGDSTGSRTLMQRFDVVGPPTMLFLDAETGSEIENTRTIGAISVEQFRRKLDQAGA
jgi:thioredoxin:protein disulfide reductase